MAIPIDRQSFAEYCLRKLGEPVIKVNVAVEQINDRIDEALQKFYLRHFDAVEPFTALFIPSDQDVENGYIELSDDIVSITEMYRPTGTGGLFSFEYRSYVDSTFGLGISSGFGTGSLSNWYITMMNLSLVNELFSAQSNFSFNKISNRLTVSGGLKNLAQTSGGVILKGYRQLLGEDAPANPSNTVTQNIWKDSWLQRYATALIKEQWGSNLLKYSGVAMIGGVSLNGDRISEEAKAELEKLEEELSSTYELPVDFFMA